MREFSYCGDSTDNRGYQQWHTLTKRQSLQAIDNFLFGTKAQRENPWKGVIKKMSKAEQEAEEAGN
jgi:hypothetical protein